MYIEISPTRRCRTRRLILHLGLLILLAMARPTGITSPLRAQESGEVVELKGDEITSERLIEILAPPGGMRGLNVAPRTPHCEIYRQRLTRGTAVRGITATAAIPIEFSFNSAEIGPQAEQTLARMGQALSSERLASSCIRIEGHTDGIGSNSFNDRLSRRRAEAVVRYLTNRFSLDPQRLVAVGRGKRDPIGDNGTSEGRRRNRRVQIGNMGSGYES
jgi:outer membrane protein OmpA-like peptidoglycan-associated protein